MEDSRLTIAFSLRRNLVQGIGPTASELYTKEGVAAFWKGIFFAYGREISYTSIKLGGKVLD
jgi:hypothetical protein